MKILVTGASGFLGRAVAERLSRDASVVPITHERAVPGGVSCDVRDADAVRRLVDATRPDAVIHGAAYRQPDFCEDNPEETRRLNVESVRHFAAALPPPARLLFVSTDYVFDGTRPPYREEDPVSPINEYGRSKAEAEAVARARPGSIILRIPLLVGAGADWDACGFIREAVGLIESGEPSVQDDVIVRRPTWIAGVAEAISFLLRRENKERGSAPSGFRAVLADAEVGPPGGGRTPCDGGTIHMSAREGATRYEWLRRVADWINRPADHLRPSTELIPRRAPRPIDSTLCAERLESLGFDRFPSFREAVESALRRFRPDLLSRSAGWKE
jgi:dTDP-4-dehydrorhamnose reductase